jgi:hypothetical protein
MDQLQWYDAFVKATRIMGMQDRWIADKDWVCHIQSQDGVKDCNVSHMNFLISSKCQFTNNRYMCLKKIKLNNSLEEGEDCYCEV